MSKTRTYAYVLEHACELTGRVYPPSTEEATAFRSYIAIALRRVWEAYPWPEVCSWTKETFAQTFDSTATYTSGSVVYWPTDGNYYQAIQSTTANLSPTDITGANQQLAYWAKTSSAPAATVTWGSAFVAGDITQYPGDGKYYVSIGTLAANGGQDAYGRPSSTYFTELVPFVRTIDKYVNFDGSAKDPELAEVLEMWTQDPRLTMVTEEVEYGFYEDQILVKDALPYVYVRSRNEPPLITSDPSTIPYRFAEIVAMRGAAMMLASDGKLDLAQMLNSQAEEFTMAELDKVSVQESQTQRTLVKRT